MVYRRNLGVLGRSFQPTIQSVKPPIPTGGLNDLNALSEMPANDAIVLENIVPTQFGLRVRQGYSEWVVGLDNPVRSLIPFEGQENLGTSDRLFAVTPQGIYDVSARNTSPTLVMAFYTDPQPSPYPELAGIGNYTHFTTDADVNVLFYADGDTGLYRYDQLTDTWATAPSITGVSVSDIAFVAVHKQRVWLVESESTAAWYLPVAAIQGAATKFTFGNKFTHGGYLVGLYSWTLDGGEGVDDYLIALSSSGDLLIYQGSDPSQPDWGLVGSWFIGEIPNSRKVAVDFGSSLYFLSSYGLINVAELLRGQDISAELPSPAAKVASGLRTLISERGSLPNWQLLHFPGENQIQIIIPQPNATARSHITYVQNTLRNAWAVWRNVPILSAEVWQGEYYFGTEDGRVMLYGGSRDNTLLDGTPGTPRRFRGLTAFFPLGENAAQFVNVEYVRTVLAGDGLYSYDCKVLFDYDRNNPVAVPELLQVVQSGIGVWGVSLWGQVRWGGAEVNREYIVGNFGLGRVCSISFAGESISETVLYGWDVMYTRGGYM
jgi:hypothetical protein